jgi:membrane protease subunit HflC
MTRNRLIAAGLAALFAGWLVTNSFYIVDQRQQAIVVAFGQPVRVVNAFSENDPGLKLKNPLWEKVILLDKRNQGLEADQEEVIASDQERLVVDAFLRYRINDPLQFYRTLGDDSTAHDRIERMVNSSLRQMLGAATSNEIISGKRAQLMQQARDEVAQQARGARLGVEILDLRIKRADLPSANQDAVYHRMQTQRQQEAAQIKAVGEQQKREIMATADKEVAITLATAREEAEKTRGEGDAKRTALFAASFGRDPGFAAFYRSMQAYEAALGQGDTTMVLSPDSAFFKYFRTGPGR